MIRRAVQDSPRAHANPPTAPGAVGSDPYSSLERELISLKGDLKLQPQQAPAWEPFERAVRAAAAVRTELQALQGKLDPAQRA